MEKDFKIDNSPEQNKTIYKQMNDIKKEIEMDKKISIIKSRRNKIILIIVLLVVIGGINFYSSILPFSNLEIHEKILKYSRSLLASILMFFAGLIIPYRWYSKSGLRLFLFIFGLTLFGVVGWVRIPSLFPTVNGGQGWIRIFGSTIQVTEIYKIAYIIIIAGIFSKGKDNEDKEVNYLRNFIFVIICLVFFLTFLKAALNDLGTGLHYVMITAFLIFISDIPNKALLILSFLSFVGVFTGITVVNNFFSGYMQQRVEVYINGLVNNSYTRADAYQIYQALIGFGTGGFFGKGYGNGVQKYSYLPEIETDFAIVTFAEEMGLIGVFLVLLSFFSLFILIMRVADTAKDYFTKYLVAGIAGAFITQVIINIGVALGMLPVFGIPLPFISSGGSSLMTLFFSMGIVLNVNKSNLKMTSRKGL